MFDLPVKTLEHKKEYRKFRRFLIKDGFIMLQESIYSKLALNQTVEKNLISRIKKNRPLYGLVQILSITEKQFSSIECIVGSSKSDIVDSDERVIVL